MLLSKRLIGPLASCCLGLTALPALAEPEPPVTVDIGGRPIVIPMPGEDFVRCDGVNASWDKAMDGFMAETNRLLANFGTKDDRERIRSGNLPGEAGKTTTFNAQTLRALEREEVGTKTFASVRGKMRKEVEDTKGQIDDQMKKIADRGNASLAQETGMDASVSMGDTAVLGFFDDENKEALGFTMAFKVGHKIDGDAKEQRNVAATYILPANGRLLMLYATRDYHDESDRQEAERAVKAWGDAIIAANAKIEGEPARNIFSGVLRAALIGGGIGGLWGLIRHFTKKRTAAA